MRVYIEKILRDLNLIIKQLTFYAGRLRQQDEIRVIGVIFFLFPLDKEHVPENCGNCVYILLL